MRAVVIGRHRMLPAQLESLRRLGVESIEQVAGVDEGRLEDQVEGWARRGVRYVIVQALPLRILVRLFNVCRARGIDVLLARMEQVAVVEGEEEAMRLVEEAGDRRTFLRAPGDVVVRVVEFKGWERIVRLEVELEPL